MKATRQEWNEVLDLTKQLVTAEGKKLHQYKVLRWTQDHTDEMIQDVSEHMVKKEAVWAGQPGAYKNTVIKRAIYDLHRKNVTQRLTPSQLDHTLTWVERRTVGWLVQRYARKEWQAGVVLKTSWNAAVGKDIDWLHRTSAF